MVVDLRVGSDRHESAFCRIAKRSVSLGHWQRVLFEMESHCGLRAGLVFSCHEVRGALPDGGRRLDISEYGHVTIPRHPDIRFSGQFRARA
jgi:hypothetical protein